MSPKYATIFGHSVAAKLQKWNSRFRIEGYGPNIEGLLPQGHDIIPVDS